MDTATVSPKYRVVTARVRRALGIRPGQKVQVIPYNGRIELIPLKPIQQARGFLKGINSVVEREPNRGMNR
jgi:AbrB family looped-hinge helix DNA binding protein